jgi:hypothetical protein
MSDRPEGFLGCEAGCQPLVGIRLDLSPLLRFFISQILKDPSDLEGASGNPRRTDDGGRAPLSPDLSAYCDQCGYTAGIADSQVLQIQEQIQSGSGSEQSDTDFKLRRGSRVEVAPKYQEGWIITLAKFSEELNSVKSVLPINSHLNDLAPQRCAAPVASHYQR